MGTGAAESRPGDILWAKEWGIKIERADWMKVKSLGKLALIQAQKMIV